MAQFTLVVGGVDLADYFVPALSLALAIILTAVILGAVLLIYYLKTKKLLLPRVTLFLFDTLEAPIKTAMWLLKLEESRYDLVKTDIINRIYLEKFRKVPFKERALFLPQCLRSTKCPARLTHEGIKCVACGRCQLCKIRQEAEKLGYKVFIMPGSTFVKRMVKKYKPKAILGVGCPVELRYGADIVMKTGIIGQGVPLLRTGCVGTDVDWDELRELMNLSSNGQK